MKTLSESGEMTDPHALVPNERTFEGMRRYVPLIVVLLAVVSILLSVMKIVSYGYLPPDDALRHAAKAVSGKPWNQILVMRPDFTIDHNYGWHQILGLLHHTFGWGPDALVVFSVSSLLILFCLTPLPWLRRPEAWLMVLFGASLYGSLVRMTLGRPFILTCAITLAVLLVWRRERKPGIVLVLATVLLTAAAVWIHGSWYLFALPVFAFLLAGRWRSTLQLSVCWLAGTVIGASLTGHPVGFIVQAVRIMTSCFGHNTLQRMLVSEFQPSDGAFQVVLAVVLMLLFRKMRGLDCGSSLKNPIFMLAGLGWLFGLAVRRFWVDWGAPAAFLWLALETQEYLESRWSRTSLVRLATTAVVAGGFYLSFASDSGSRWTRNLTDEYLTAQNPELAGWLPEEGGILYSAEMNIFYETYFKNPHAEWRYVLGFEPTFMTPEDLKIYRNIQWNFGATKAYLPWVEKMRVEDRLAVRGAASSQPAIKELEWHYAVSSIWLGRLPRTPPAKP
jgi:hypothetical protein